MKHLVLCLFSVLACHAALAEEGAEHGEKAEHRNNAALFPQPKPNLAIGEAPPAPVLSEPAFEASVPGDSVTLKWNAADHANQYHVQVATDPNFKWLKAEDHWVKGTSFEVKGLEKGKLYFWRVASWKDDSMAAANKSNFASSSFETK